MLVYVAVHEILFLQPVISVDDALKVTVEFDASPQAKQVLKKNHNLKLNFVSASKSVLPW